MEVDKMVRRWLRYNLPFTKGTTLKGNTYSDLTCLPVRDVETRNNPNFKS